MSEPKLPIKNALRLPLILFAAGALVVIVSSFVGVSDRTTGNIFRAIGILLLLAGLVGTCFPLKRSQRYSVYYKHSPGQVTGTLLVNAIIFAFNGRDLDEQIHSFLSK